MARKLGVEEEGRHRRVEKRVVRPPRGQIHSNLLSDEPIKTNTVTNSPETVEARNYNFNKSSFPFLIRI